MTQPALVMWSCGIWEDFREQERASAKALRQSVVGITEQVGHVAGLDKGRAAGHEVTKQLEGGICVHPDSSGGTLAG